MTGAVGRYAAVSLGLVLVTAGLFLAGFRAPGEPQAIWLSAGVAVGLQAVAVAVRQAAGSLHLTARMAAGMIVRFVGLVGYAVIAVKLLLLPATAALLSFATFLFLMLVLEPVLIKP